MKKVTKYVLIGMLVCSFCAAALSTAFACSVHQALTDYKQKNICDVLILRARIQHLEDKLQHSLDAVVDKTIDILSPRVETEPESSPYDTAEVTYAPGHAAEAPTDVYVISTYRGIIGIFDADGQLLRTVNVSVDTLPEVDRQALSQGLRVDGWPEMLKMIEKYQ